MLTRPIDAEVAPPAGIRARAPLTMKMTGRMSSHDASDEGSMSMIGLAACPDRGRADVVDKPDVGDTPSQTTRPHLLEPLGP